MLFIPLRALNGIDQLLSQYGLDQRAVFAAVGLDPELLSQADGFISGEDFSALLEHLAHSLGQPHLGLQLAKIQGGSILGTLWFLLRNAPTLGASLDTLIRNYASHTEATFFSAQDVPGGRLLQYEVNPQIAGQHRQVIELGLAIASLELRTLLGPNWQPAGLYLRGPKPRDSAPLRQVFGDNLHFDQDYNGLLFLSDELSQSTLGASQLQGHYYRQQLQRQQLLNPRGLLAQVENIINAGLGHHPCSLNFVAASLGLKPRTLQHQLQQQGSSFKAIHQRVRLQLALRYIEDSQLSMTAIANRLHFNDSAVFSRFIKSHCGQSPRQIRRGHCP